jgi:hypothetical protein
MKKAMMALLILGAVPALGQVQSPNNVNQCTEKVAMTVLGVARLEVRDPEMVRLTQKALATATDFTVTVVSRSQQAHLVYKVNTIDITSKYPCVINSILLSNSN